MVKNKKRFTLVVAGFLLIIIGLFFYHFRTQEGKKAGYQYLVGLSLPNSTISRNRHLIYQVSEHKREIGDMNILVKEAQDSGKQQLKDVIELEKYGIDLLVISPMEDKDLLDKIKNMSIPVIILHQRDYAYLADAFIEYDNVAAGELLANNLGQIREPILVLSGDEKDFVSKEREAGFLNALSPIERKSVEIIDCHWNRNEAENQMKAYLVSGKKVSQVVAFNDQMAYGAYLACHKLRTVGIQFYGINGFKGSYKGIDLVERNILDGSVTFEDMYDAIVRVSQAILKKENFEPMIKLKARFIK